MKADVRAALTAELSDLSVEIAADLRETILRDPGARARAQRLHEAERVGEDFELWTDLLSRRAAVMWVLRSVYLRVLEDRGLLRTPRLVDPDAETLFRRLAPDLGATAFFRWVYRDLAKPAAGLAELFAPTPAEVAEPSNELSRRLLEFWREVDPDTGELRWRFDQEDFDSRLLGDLYQDLDPVVKQRYALLQTPDFVVDYILDETLEPAIAQWGVETVRLIDPACGSGHFLLAAFDRLFRGLREARPALSAEEAAQDVLGRVVGIDLNDYACALARARLVMHALEASGSTDLADAADLHPLVFWADGLDQVEREAAEEATPAGEIAQLGFGESYGVAPSVVVAEKPAAMLTPREVRDALRPVLAGGFHAVVANPPYITEKDKARKKYHKEKVGGQPRYVSAYMKYSLGCPFTERCFQLATAEDGGGFVGMITANSFMKRTFGRALIEQFFPTVTLTSVVDTSGAYIPGHGTPTVLLFGRSAKPSEGDLVWAVLGKRGEPSVPEVAAEGEVWASIEDARDSAGFENEFVSVAELAQGRFHEHPWSLQGGGAVPLQQALEKAPGRLEEHTTEIGFASFPGNDDAFVMQAQAIVRRGVPNAYNKPFITGDSIRNWQCSPTDSAIAAYDNKFEPVEKTALGTGAYHFWLVRSSVLSTMGFGGISRKEAGEREWTWYRWIQDRYEVPLSIAFAFVATHNHFVLDRGGSVFNRHAPVIKLPAEATVDDHLVLLGQLNSSTACFWMKQVFMDRGGGGIGGGLATEDWERFYEHDSTKMLAFPVATDNGLHLMRAAHDLDETATARVDDDLRATISSAAAEGAQQLRSALENRRSRDIDRLLHMTALQEELDWLCYALYNVDPAIDLTDSAIAALPPDETPPLCPGQRTFEIRLASADAERRAAIERGDAPSQTPTEWFSRHGWEPVTDTANIENAAYRARVKARLAAIKQSKALQLLEQPTFKRRWYRPDYEKEEREALDAWLVDRLEDWAKDEQQPWTLTEVAMALESDPAVRAVCEVRTGRPDFSLVAELERLVAQDHVPNNKHHVYKPRGLEKRRAWERTWELQHAEDRGEDVDVDVPVPPKYRAGEFRKSAYWRLRGKLDVPKERFIAFQEMPGATGERALFGWAGWTPMQRAKVLLELDEKAENAGVSIEQRYGLLYGVWFQLPWVAWESEAAAEEFRAVVQDLVGAAGVTEVMLAEWARETS